MDGIWQMYRRKTGFSLVELLIVIALIGILMGVALPPYLSWRANAQYRQAGNGLLAAVRTARSTAITTNRQIQVELSGTTYRTRNGNRALASTDWSNTSWISLPPGVGLTTANSRIIANPNGTFFFSNSTGDPVSASASTTMSIFVQDSSVTPAVSRYTVSISQAGRISLNLSN